MSLNVYTSNRMELLLETFVESLGRPADPFSPETIVVQSKGLQRWLAMELAKRFGVWANADYPFPNKCVWDLFRKVLKDLPETSPFEPSFLLWRIMRLLPRHLETPAFASLQSYLGGKNHDLKLFQLSGKIADTFDQYTLFRSDLLEKWEAGQESHWQAELWRALVSETGNLHRAEIQKRFLQALAEGAGTAGSFPSRITLFGISYLPKFHLDFLAAVSTFSEVNLFVMSPCREYWSDILPARSLVRLSPENRTYRIEGNPLLASLGRLGRDFSEMILEYGEAGGGTDDLYRQTSGSTLLELVQNDILALEGPGETGLAKITFRSDDFSLKVHCCHSPMREVEVLHDTLLGMFASLKDLAPRDILVMTPDIETYAPYISAVFDGSQGGGRRIPYSIADRNIRSDGLLTQALLAIFDLPGKRFPVTRVMEILSFPAVCAAFGIAAADLDQIRAWLEELRVRWGMDEDERSREGFPRYRENSWRAGLDRLLLGYAMPEENELFDGILPFDDMEGDGPERSGKLVRFVESLYGLVEKLDRQRTLVEWEILCREILADFFLPGEDESQELSFLNALFDSLRTLPELTDFREAVGLPVLRSWLHSAIARQERGLGFMTGGVTFCAMLPMRSIPFRVIVLLGMNDSGFPRQSRPTGFDLIAREPRRGDRSLRDEDRYLFLEALLSARESFVLSYTGQSIRDNAPLPPSVLVDELLEYLERRFSDGSETFPARLVTRQRLQPFSPDYFSGEGKLFSFSEENYRAVRSRLDGVRPLPPFFTELLPEPPADLREISLENLLAFYDNPARYLLRTRIGIRLDDLVPPLEDREPFGLDPLEAYQIRCDMLEQLLAGRATDQLLDLTRAKGVLPPARQGELLFRGVESEVTNFAAGIRSLMGDRPALEPLVLELEIAGFRVSGRLSGIWPEQLLRYRCAKRSGRDQMRLWIEHLLLNELQYSGYPRVSVLATTDGILRLRPVADSCVYLRLLLETYWLGLRKPLKFFPRSSLAFAKKGDLGSARIAWSGDRFPEGADPYYQLCFGDTDPLDEEFVLLSQALLEPLLRHCEG
ncbi:MAG: exodeoxyribonuclease V subunit gamma [Deltaproteobacteria bacterium]|nr:exodeoxyribonuclease V subunit gamma [Deltaproteobacteria bacterium]TLN03489.1 MAG: exodeoxyribonuclease V subunit gamma [bacterium]